MDAPVSPAPTSLDALPSKRRRTVQPEAPRAFSRAVLDAAKQFIARRDRAEHPDGRFDNAKRWYPTSTEECSCCSVYPPSRAYPFGLLIHCRTARHCAELHGVDESDVRACARALDKGIEFRILDTSETSDLP